ncbi:MAG: hypothetical protein U0793_32185, partial [Gemmataceae bacterium]
QTSAHFKGGVRERLLGRFRPKVELVSGGSALEAAQGMLDEIGGKHAVAAFFAMQGARSPNLASGGSGSLKTEWPKDIRHGNRLSNFAKVDGRHALLLTRTEKRNP